MIYLSFPFSSFLFFPSNHLEAKREGPECLWSCCICICFSEWELYRLLITALFLLNSKYYLCSQMLGMNKQACSGEFLSWALWRALPGTRAPPCCPFSPPTYLISCQITEVQLVYCSSFPFPPFIFPAIGLVSNSLPDFVLTHHFQSSLNTAVKMIFLTGPNLSALLL